jgi:hypothetical protein
MGDAAGFVPFEVIDRTDELRAATARMDYRAY